MTAAAPHSLASSVRRRTVRRRGGFTLIEIVLVLVVLCAIMALTVPQLRGFLTASGARDSATQVVALAQYARARSAADAVVYRLSFDETSGAYQLSADDGTGSFSELGNDFGLIYQLPKDMTVRVERPTSSAFASASAQPGDIDFRPDGTSDLAVIRLTDADGFETLIAAPAPTEPFRIMTAEEVDEL